eukprot:1614643-Amphidinium_carterae.1
MTGVRQFNVADNAFDAMLTTEAVRSMMGMKEFYLASNRFQGKLPVEGMRGMTALNHFWLNRNGFEGMLAAEVLCHPRLMNVILSDNHFEGSLPEVSPFTLTLMANQNILAGTVPAAFLGSTFGVSGMIHEGTLPMSLSRITQKPFGQSRPRASLVDRTMPAIASNASDLESLVKCA